MSQIRANPDEMTEQEWLEWVQPVETSLSQALSCPLLAKFKFAEQCVEIGGDRLAEIADLMTVPRGSG